METNQSQENVDGQGGIIVVSNEYNDEVNQPTGENETSQSDQNKDTSPGVRNEEEKQDERARSDNSSVDSQNELAAKQEMGQ